MQNIPDIGPIANGVIPNEQMIPIFIETLQKFNAEKAKEHDALFQKMLKAGSGYDDFSTDMLMKLYDDLNQCAPENMFFGLNPDAIPFGSKLEYGFWKETLM